MSDTESNTVSDLKRVESTESVPTLKTEQEKPQHKDDQPVEKQQSRSNSTVSFKLEEDDTLMSLPKQTPSTASSSANATLKKKEIIRPLFSKSNTTDKMTKPVTSNKTMIVETETVDASNAPSVTLPIQNVLSANDLLSNNSTISNNLSSLRSKKSTLFVDSNTQITSNNSNNMNQNTSSNDENNSVINLNNSLNNNDSASINGSIRGFNKRLVQPDLPHTTISSKPGATKADLFAAKVANAVGDASDSDSEETFVYESAPDALNSTNSAKTTSGNLNSNTLALRKLSQRNISMPVTFMSNINTPSLHHPSNLSTVNDNSSTINLVTTTDNDESDSLISQHNHSPQSHQILQDKTELNQNQHSLDESQTSISDHNPSSRQEPFISSNQDMVTLPSSINESQAPQSTVSKPSLETVQVQPLYQPKTRVFTKYTGESQVRKPSSISLLTNPRNNNSQNSHTNQLRTTTSKLFDVKGSTLRRYSGVPDDVNIEDYIDQHDEDQELGLDNYSDTYDFDDYEEDNELTPLNITKSNNKLRNKVSKNYFIRNNFPHFRSTDSGETYNDTGSFVNVYKEDVISNGKGKSRKYRNKSHQTQRIQEPYSPHNFHNSKRQSRIQTFKNFIYLFSFMFLLLTFGFVAGFLLATTKDLQTVSIKSIDDVVVSYDELVFDVFVEAFNPGFVSVSVEEVELDVFAKSEFVKSEPKVPIFIDETTEQKKATVETILLGSVSKLEVPLIFSSGFFNRNHSISKGSIKLIHPGQNSTSSNDGETDENHKLENDLEKWRGIMKHPFDLILKGRLKYELPFFGSKRSISVTKTVGIDPTAKEIINS